MGITVVKTRKLDDDSAAGDAPLDFDNGDATSPEDTPNGADLNTNDVDLEVDLNEHEYQFDYFVIGGGSGGIASAIQAAKFGVRVGLCDFVAPTPSGTSWGLGGTCVNVGCIPKKLMHQAALLGQSLEDAADFGWVLEDPSGVGHNHNWSKMVDKIHSHILSLNWGYRVSLQKAGVEYYNALAEFQDEHTVKLSGKNGEEMGEITAKYFLIATGGRPRYLDIPGGTPGEYCITSDDIFTLAHNPGKVVIVGASYIALETAGFLNGMADNLSKTIVSYVKKYALSNCTTRNKLSLPHILGICGRSAGLDVTVMVRSQLLRGFDQQMAEKIGEVLESHGVQLVKDCVPFKIEAISEGSPGVLMVHAENTKTGDILEEPCNTVILAVGRSPNVSSLNLDKVQVDVDPESGKILANDHEQTSVPNIFAVGDVCQDRPELTPVAIQSGVLLARRLFGKSTLLTEYDKVATTVFTPLEYGCVGWSEEKATEVYGEDDVEVYHVTSQPLEFTLPQRDKNACYSKLICVKSEQERICGFHYLGPNAGEITQGFALAIKLNAKKEDLDNTIGIHPTCAEHFTTLNVTKRSGENWVKTSC